MRRIHYQFKTKAMGTMPAVTAKVTMELSDFGHPVKVEPPPRDQTVDASELHDRAQGSP